MGKDIRFRLRAYGTGLDGLMLVAESRMGLNIEKSGMTYTLKTLPLRGGKTLPTIFYLTVNGLENNQPLQ